jgi:hypothetical protein
LSRRGFWATYREALRAALWIYNVQQYVQDHPKMPKQQKLFVEQAVRILATPAFGSDEHHEGPAEEQEKLRIILALKTKAEELFHNDRYRLFYRLGDEPVTPLVTGRALSDSSIVSESLSQCNCDDWFDCNPIWPSVQCRKEQECVPVPHNCGFWQEDACTGLC